MVNVAGINSYNGFCCDPGPVNNSAIFGSRKNRMSCVTDHTKGLEKETILSSTLQSWRIAYLTPSNVLHEDQRCSGSSRADLQNQHRLESSSILMRCLLNHPCPVKNWMKKLRVGRPNLTIPTFLQGLGNHCLV